MGTHFAAKGEPFKGGVLHAKKEPSTLVTEIKGVRNDDRVDGEKLNGGRVRCKDIQTSTYEKLKEPPLRPPEGAHYHICILLALQNILKA